jgi:hypothetical protein
MEVKTYTADQLKEVLKLHAAFLEGNPEGVKANLQSADLRSADLQSANLRSADLRSADLQYANLRSADLRSANLQSADLQYANLRSAIIPTGESWTDYLGQVVPALLAAGGKSIEQIVAAGAWDCHSWENCPMACAFAIKKETDAPILLRPRVQQFVQFFDAKLIPCPFI